MIFITPPSAAELEKRLRSRGTESEEAIKGRLARAHEESVGMDTYDFIVINDDLEECVDEVHRIIELSKKQPVRMQPFIEDMKNQLKVYG